jgi:hypothetical protein
MSAFEEDGAKETVKLGNEGDVGKETVKETHAGV